MKRTRLLETGSTHLVEVVSNDLPDAGPLQPDTVHVVIGDLHDLLQAEHPGLVGRGQLVHGDRAEPSNKIHCVFGFGGGGHIRVGLNIIITIIIIIILESGPMQLAHQ